MKIDMICNDGSPIGVSLASLLGDDPFQPGCGGSEAALLTMCEAWNKRGDKVRLYNNPRIANGSPFEQLPLTAFNPQDDRDVLIVFRSPNVRAYGAKGLKVWWSCDSHTIGNYAEFAATVNKVVTISPSHDTFFKINYRIDNSIPIDLAVRTWEYEQPIEKVKHRCIFTSVPDRGIVELMQCWPVIEREVPDATLVVTSDYKLWGCGAARNEHILPLFLGKSNVKNMGSIRRSQLVEEEMKADLFIYPCTFHEMFCISLGEAQVAGAYPITSDAGSLPTTNIGTVINGNPKDDEWRKRFIESVVGFLRDDNLTLYQDEIRKKAKERFSIERILSEWDTKVFN